MNTVTITRNTDGSVTLRMGLWESARLSGCAAIAALIQLIPDQKN
jgi:hypothetical protein